MMPDLFFIQAEALYFPSSMEQLGDILYSSCQEGNKNRKLIKF